MATVTGGINEKPQRSCGSLDEVSTFSARSRRGHAASPELATERDYRSRFGGLSTRPLRQGKTSAPDFFRRNGAVPVAQLVPTRIDTRKSDDARGARATFRPKMLKLPPLSVWFKLKSISGGQIIPFWSQKP